MLCVLCVYFDVKGEVLEGCCCWWWWFLPVAMVRLALLSAFCPSAAKGREESELFPPNAPLKLVASLVALVAIVAILLACLLRSLRRLLSKYLSLLFLLLFPHHSIPRVREKGYFHMEMSVA